MPFGAGPLYSEATQQLVNRLKEEVIRCHLGQEAQAHAAGISEQKISHCPQKGRFVWVWSQSPLLQRIPPEPLNLDTRAVSWMSPSNALRHRWVSVVSTEKTLGTWLIMRRGVCRESLCSSIYLCINKIYWWRVQRVAMLPSTYNFANFVISNN